MHYLIERCRLACVSVQLVSSAKHIVKYQCLIDRDSALWNLDMKETHRRRCLLYEIYTYDSFQVITQSRFISLANSLSQSLTFGRPPSFSLAHIDTKMPHTSTTNMSGEIEMSCMPEYVLRSLSDIICSHSCGLEAWLVLRVPVYRSRPSLWGTLPRI